MRRKILLLMLSICLLFSACDLGRSKHILDHVDKLKLVENADSTYNYNNINSKHGLLFLNDTLFYSSDGFSLSARYLRWITPDEEYFMVTSEDIADSHIHCKMFLINGKIYFIARRDDRIHRVYSIDLDTAKLENVCKINGAVVQWFMLEDNIVYLTIDMSEHQELYLYNLGTEEEKKLSDNVVRYGIGVVDNKLRFITRDDDYSIYDYDLTHGIAEKVASIPGNVAFGYGKVNFTKDHVVVYTPYLRSFIVCDLKGGVNQYVLPTTVSEFVAADSYAYTILYDDVNTGSESNAGLYRIDLSTGEATRLMDSVDDNGTLYVQDDETVYVIPGEYGFNGIEFKAIKINGNSGACEELFEFDY